ncbi:MAG: hypothetical protein HOF04_06015 [Candidatus Marinimicrobia bacterium]|nr:hypothetical protein [Candidatus Neomarinimicrobiota bacterium]MBT6368245.1 hypothetical protein [Candidatus Neomarinimicrobiota bacterium]MBT7871910.1 hypothetical protein [Candidatus Neomarinimicrobiota bacterium]
MRYYFLTFLVFILTILPRTGIAQSNLEVTTSVFYPRLKTFDIKSTYLSSLLNYHQSFGSFKLSTRFEYGSETSQYINPFRMYEFNVNWKHHPFSITLGRFNYWSSYANVNVDGFQAGFSTKRFGKIELIGGFKSVLDFSDTTYVQPSFFSDGVYINKILFQTSWSFYKKNKFINISYMTEGGNDTLRPLVGFASNWKMFGLIIHETIVMDLDQSELNYTRLSISKILKSHRLKFGVHQLRLNGIHPWPWVEKMDIPVTYTAGWAWSLKPQMEILQKVNFRAGTNSTVFYNSQLFYGQYYVSIIAGIRENNEVYGGTVGMAKKAGKTVKFGGNVSFNIFNYNDIIEPINASSVYGWLDWNLIEKLNIKFFGRYIVNAYYKKDGRAGVIVYVKM